MYCLRFRDVLVNSLSSLYYKLPEMITRIEIIPVRSITTVYINKHVIDRSNDKTNPQHAPLFQIRPIFFKDDIGFHPIITSRNLRNTAPGL